jgi:hypothetical protein
VISAPELASGATYTLYSGGGATGSVTDEFYQAGDYASGAEYASFTLPELVTQIGSRVR